MEKSLCKEAHICAQVYNPAASVRLAQRAADSNVVFPGNEYVIVHGPIGHAFDRNAYSSWQRMLESKSS
jgi:hypothetical protein